jgi:hypothetical protein
MSLEIAFGLTKLRGDRSQVAAVDGHGGVVGAKRRLVDLKRPLKLRSGAGQVPKIPQHQAQRVAVPRHLHSLWAKPASVSASACSATGRACRYRPRLRR